MNLNINAQFHDELDEASWTLLGKDLSRAVKQRLAIAFIETVSMFNSETPLMLTLSEKEPPELGEVAPGVFFCRPEIFQVEEPLVMNTAFWDQCMNGRGFADSLASLGALLEDEREMEAQLKQWSMEYGFHCLHVFPE